METTTSTNIKFDIGDFEKNMKEARALIDEFNSKPRLKAIKVTSEVYNSIRQCCEKTEKSVIEKFKDLEYHLTGTPVIVDEDAEYPFTPVWTTPVIPEQQGTEG